MSDPIVDPLPPVLTHSTLNLLAGASGVGKTALIAYMARCFLKGEPLFGYTPSKIPAVGYIGADRAWTNDTARWFTKYGLNPDDIPHYALVEDRSFSTMRFRKGTKPNALASVFAEVFEEHVDKLALPIGSLLFVDPIALYVGATMNDYVKCAMGCIDLQRVIRDRKLCTIGVDHSSKQKGGEDSKYTRLQDRIGGSMAKLGYTSTQMYLAGPEEMEADHHTFLWNPHHAKSQTFQLKQDPETGLFTPLGDNRILTPTTQPIVIPDPVRAFYHGLPDPPAIISPAYVITLCADAYSRRTVFRYLALLEKAGLVTKTAYGAYVKVVRDFVEVGESEDEA